MNTAWVIWALTSAALCLPVGGFLSITYTPPESAPAFVHVAIVVVPAMIMAGLVVVTGYGANQQVDYLIRRRLEEEQALRVRRNEYLARHAQWEAESRRLREETHRRLEEVLRSLHARPQITRTELLRGER